MMWMILALHNFLSYVALSNIYPLNIFLNQFCHLFTQVYEVGYTMAHPMPLLLSMYCVSPNPLLSLCFRFLYYIFHHVLSQFPNFSTILILPSAIQGIYLVLMSIHSIFLQLMDNSFFLLSFIILRDFAIFFLCLICW